MHLDLRLGHAHRQAPPRPNLLISPARSRSSRQPVPVITPLTPTGTPQAEMSLLTQRGRCARSCRRWHLCFPLIFAWLSEQPRHAILTFRTPVETVTPPLKRSPREGSETLGPGSDGTWPPETSGHYDADTCHAQDPAKQARPAHVALAPERTERVRALRRASLQATRRVVARCTPPGLHDRGIPADRRAP